MNELDSSIKDLVMRALEKAAPAEVPEFRKLGDRIVHEIMQKDPEVLRDELVGTKPAVRTRGPEMLLGFETLSVAVTLTSILVHIWHERTMLKLTREQQSAVAKFRVLWREWLVKRGFDPQEAERIASELDDDVHELLLLKQQNTPRTR